MKRTTRRRILLACSGVMAIAGGALLSYDRWSALVPTPDPADRARRIGDASGILIGYGDPAAFYVPPYRPEDAKLPAVEMRAAGRSAVWFALDGIEPSLAQYPPGFVAKLIKAIFVSGIMKIDGERAAGTYGRAWVLLAASIDIGAADITVNARRGVHHELSSFVYYRGDNATTWQQTIPADWPFPTSIGAQLRLSRDRRPPVETGFLTAYGASAPENDFNVYVEMMMTEMDTVMQLARRVPVVARKAALVRRIYAAIDPRMDAVFSALGMTGDGSKEAP
jgi:hypothetical protein